MKRRYDLLYAIGALITSPVLVVGLLRTGKWRTDWRGRFGKTPPLPPDPRPTLLLHGVSVGEINATRALVALLEESDSSKIRLVISATTNTGFDRAKELFADRHSVVRFPFDFSWMMSRFLDRLEPSAVALMELEVWPNLAQECRRRAIPLAVINGRLSSSSFGTYRWARRWVRPMFEGLEAVAAQTEGYAERFRELGTPADRVSVTDNMKWDSVKLVDEVEGAQELAADMGIDLERPLVVAGSTGPGEEEMLVRERPEGVQLLLVPRKPERFEEVARLFPGIVRRSKAPLSDFSDGAANRSGDPPTLSRDLFLLDAMGELTMAYSLADVAIVGRSLVPLGGSDPIESAALGIPTLIGPRHENFEEVVAALADGGALRISDRPMELARELLADPEARKAMGKRGREVIRQRQGATANHARLLGDLVSGRMEALEEELFDVRGGKVPKGRKPRRRVRRWLLPLLVLYMSAGYLTTAFRWVETEAGVPVGTPLPDVKGALLSGVFSVHTERSHDARGTRLQVADAAASAGLDFVIVGDHPRSSRRPEWEIWDPMILEGVFIEGGQELRTPERGKVLAIGVDTTFRTWEGSYDALVDLLRREQATSFVVHSRGPRLGERWIQPTAYGVQGWEVLDVSEATRHRLKGPWGVYHLLTFLGGLPFGLGDEALLHLMRDGFETPTVAAYDSLRMAGPLTATAGLNIHPKLRLGPVLAPPYGPFFRTLVGHVAVQMPLPADPVMGSAILSNGFRRGDLFLSLGDHEEAMGFRLGAFREGVLVGRMGTDVGAGDGTVLRAGFQEDSGHKLLYRVLCNGSEVAWVRGPGLEWDASDPGVYRVEVYSYSARLGNLFIRLRPWIFSNPIGLRFEGASGD